MKLSTPVLTYVFTSSGCSLFWSYFRPPHLLAKYHGTDLTSVGVGDRFENLWYGMCCMYIQEVLCIACAVQRKSCQARSQNADQRGTGCGSVQLLTALAHTWEREETQISLNFFRGGGRSDHR